MKLVLLGLTGGLWKQKKKKTQSSFGKQQQTFSTTYLGTYIPAYQQKFLIKRT